MSRLSMFVLVVALAGSGSGQAGAAAITWDSNGDVSPNPQDGAGTWDTTALNWWTGSASRAWVNANKDTAVFGAGGAADTVTLAVPISVGGLQFNSVSSGTYAITGSTLSFTAGTATTGIVANAPATISSTLAATATPLVFSLGKVTLSGTGANMTGVGNGFNVGPVGTTNGSASVSITDGTNTFGEILVGRGNGFAGALYITGGTTTFSGGGGSGIGVGSGGNLNAEPNANGTSFGFGQMTDGTVNCIEWNIGNRDRGVFYLSGGTLNDTLWPVNVGGRNGGTGVMDMTGGTFNISGGNGGNSLAVGGAASVMNLRGGTINITSPANKTININNGILNLAGGAITGTPAIVGGGMLNFNGGTIQVRGDVNVVNLLQNTNTYIQAGGATIDTNGRIIGISSVLRAPTGNGVTGISGSLPATALTGAPQVQITGGGGTGATGIAQMNADGTIASVVITNPGQNYTSAPTVTLYHPGLTGGSAVLTGTTGAVTSGGLTKVGAGILMLSGANTYTGETRAREGVLVLGGGQVAGGSSLALENAVVAATSSMNVNNLTLGAAGSDAMTLRLLAGDSSNRIITATGVIGNASAKNALLNVGWGGWTVGNTYPLINYTTATGASGTGVFDLAPGSKLFGALVDSGTSVAYQVTSLPDGGPFVYTGAYDGNWDFGTPNFKGAANAAALFPNTAPNAVTFDDTATGPTDIMLWDTFTPESVTVNNSWMAYTFGGIGKISGTGGLVKDNSGTLVLANSFAGNDYSGDTQLKAGTLQLGASGALSANSKLVFSGGTLDMNGFNGTAGGLSGASGTITNYGTAISTLTASVPGGSLSYGGTVATGTSQVSLTKTGAGTQVISSAGNTVNTLLVNNGSFLFDNSLVADPSLTINGELDATGNSGMPTAVFHNATLTLNNRMRVGHDGNGRGTITFRGNSAIAQAASYVDVAFNGGNGLLTFADSAKFNTDPGSASKNIELRIGQAWQCNAQVVVQDSASAVFGPINIGYENAVANSFSYDLLTVGKIASDTASLTGTTLVVGRRTNNATATLYAQYNQNGGTANIKGDITLASDKTAGTLLMGSINLAGGVLQTSTKVAAGTNGGKSYFNFHGGTLAYSGTAPQANFLDLGANGNAYVYEGGAIDTGAQSVTLTKPLLTPNTASGVISIPVTAGGTGYFVPPTVRITPAAGDTAGAGATAVANVDPATGAVTGITITNPGTGYTAAPTIVLDRGVGTGATLGAAVIATNAYSGGLTVKGATGTLIMNAVNTYTGDTTVQGGTLKLGVVNAIGSTGGGLVAKTGGTVDLNTLNPTFTGNVSFQGGAVINGSITKNAGNYDAQSGAVAINLGGTAGLAKSTSGVFSLTGAQSYAGPTTVNAGELQLGGTLASGGVTVASGATLSAIGSGATMGNLTLGSLGTDALTLNATVGSAIFNVTANNGLTNNGVTTIKVAGTLVSGQQYILIDYAGALQGTFNFTPAFTGRTSGQILNNLANTSIDVLIGNQDNPMWTGKYSGDWDTTTKNWKLINSGEETAFLQNTDTVLFDGTAVETNVNLTGAMSPTGITVNNPVSKPYRFVGTGKITGVTGLVKQGDGALTIDNVAVNDYSGPTTITGGSLALGSDNAISANSDLVVAGGTLDLNYFSQTTSRAVTLQGGSITNGALTKNTGAFVVESGTVSAILAGTAGLTKSTAGAVTLAAANTYSGATTLNAGTLNLDNGGDAASSALGTGPLVINGGGLGNTSLGWVVLGTNNPQTWAGDFAFIGPDDLDLGTGSVSLAATRTVTVTTGNLAVGGVIAGAANGLTKAGRGTLTIGGANTFSGDTRIAEGTLRLTNSLALQNSVLDLNTADAGTLEFGGISSATLGGLKGAGPLTIPGGMNLSVGKNNQATTYSGVITGLGNLTKIGTGTLTLSSVGSTLGTLSTQAGKLVIDDSASADPSVSVAALDLRGASMLVSTNTVSPSPNLTIQGDFTLAVDGAPAFLVVAGKAQVAANLTRLTFNGHTAAITLKDNAQYNAPTNEMRMGEAYQNNTNFRIQDSASATFNYVNVGHSMFVGNAKACNTLYLSDNASLTSNGMAVSNDVHVYWGPANGTGELYGKVEQTGGANTVNGVLDIGVNENHDGAGSPAGTNVGTYNLRGGELKTNRVRGGNSPTPGIAAFNFNGGKLTYNGVGPATEFFAMGARGTATIHSGGATIDDSGQEVTISQSLLGANGQGVTAINGGLGGSYKLPPYVLITGGTGSGATAEATLDASGAITGYAITNPGSGYAPSDSLTVTLLANPDNGSGAASASASLGAVTSGGLTKIGSGTLTLSGANTYAGGTRVDAGTLALASVGALPAGGALTIEAGGTVVLVSGLSAAAGTGGGRAAQPVPEPSALALLAAAAAGGLWLARRRSRSAGK